jgi:SAM-dependent methyltransferase
LTLKSYSSGLRGFGGFVREATHLIRVYSTDLSQQVAVFVAHVQRMQHLVETHLGIRMQGLSMLDVGAGQRLIQMRYFAGLGNDVTGVDRDLIVQGLDLPGYVRMARSNGVRRAVKTMGRKLLGFDARFAAEFQRQLGNDRRGPRRLCVLQMDATDLRFPSDSFDFAYSTSVMQYLPDPAAALREIARVVQPGGGAYVDFMPFTGPTGCLDIRILGGHGALPRWAHLRPETASIVQENAPLNRLRLAEWHDIFDDAMPGNTFVLDQPDAVALEREAREAHEAGALLDYSLEELLTMGVAVLWQKPAAT